MEDKKKDNCKECELGEFCKIDNRFTCILVNNNRQRKRKICTPIELFLGIMLTLFGIVLLLPFHTFLHNGEYTIMQKIADENVWGIMCLLIGLFQIIVTLKSKGKQLRVISLSMQTFSWTLIGSIFLVNDIFIDSTLNTSFSIYIGLAILSLYTAYRLR